MKLLLVQDYVDLTKVLSFCGYGATQTAWTNCQVRLGALRQRGTDLQTAYRQMLRQAGCWDEALVTLDAHLHFNWAQFFAWYPDDQLAIESKLSSCQNILARLENDLPVMLHRFTRDKARLGARKSFA